MNNETRSDWFSHECLPLLAGVYETQDSVTGKTWFNFFDGCKWYWGTRSPETSYSMSKSKYNTMSAENILHWRGLAEAPSLEEAP